MANKKKSYSRRGGYILNASGAIIAQILEGENDSKVADLFTAAPDLLFACLKALELNEFYKNDKIKFVDETGAPAACHFDDSDAIIEIQNAVRKALDHKIPWPAFPKADGENV